MPLIPASTSSGDSPCTFSEVWKAWRTRWWNRNPLRSSRVATFSIANASATACAGRGMRCFGIAAARRSTKSSRLSSPRVASSPSSTDSCCLIVLRRCSSDSSCLIVALASTARAASCSTSLASCPLRASSAEQPPHGVRRWPAVGWFRAAGCGVPLHSSERVPPGTRQAAASASSRFKVSVALLPLAVEVRLVLLLEGLAVFFRSRANCSFAVTSCDSVFCRSSLASRAC